MLRCHNKLIIKLEFLTQTLIILHERNDQSMKIDLKIINTFIKNTQNAGAVNEVANESAKPFSETKNTAQAANLAEQNAVFVQNQTVKFNSISRMEQAVLIKGLMNLPEDIKELLSFLINKEVSEETAKALLKNQKINTDLIKHLLENNSKESMNKLLKLFQQSPGGTQNTEQLKEILTLLSFVTPKKNATANEVLTNLTLLYLPWLPLSEKQEIEIWFEKYKSKENNEESEQTALVIYITTINLGKFKATLLLNKDGAVNIQIENFCEAGTKEIKEHLENILSSITNQTKKDKIPITTELYICERAETSEERKREVIISPVKDVSQVMIITAQKIAKIILEADEKISLLETRKEMTK